MVGGVSIETVPDIKVQEGLLADDREADCTAFENKMRMLRPSIQRKSSVYLLRRQMLAELVDKHRRPARSGEHPERNDGEESDREILPSLRRSVSCLEAEVARLQTSETRAWAKAAKLQRMLDGVIDTLRDEGISVSIDEEYFSNAVSTPSSPTSTVGSISTQTASLVCPVVLTSQQSTGTVDERPERNDDSGVSGQLVSVMMLDDLRQKQQELPSLRGFLHKLSPRKRLVRVWQKRFFFVRDSELCYSREKLDANLQEDTLGWYLVNAISLLSIKRIFPSQVQPLQFGVEACDPKCGHLRKYMFKASSSALRNHWVNGLQKHLQYQQNLFRLQNPNASVPASNSSQH